MQKFFYTLRKRQNSIFSNTQTGLYRKLDLKELTWEGCDINYMEEFYVHRVNKVHPFFL